jgi:capsular polysaccharide biosynthesis protein
MGELSPYTGDGRARTGSAPASARAITPAEQTFFHFDILRSLQMHRGLALGIVLAALVLSAGYTGRRWNNYKAQSLVYVQPSPPHLLQNGQPQQQWPFDANTYESYIQQQIHNVTRPDVLAAAVRRLPGYRGAKESDQAAADRLGGNIEVARVSTGYQISITATAGNAAEAASIANAVAQSFIESTTRELRSGDSERIALLRDERDRVQKELDSDRAEQETLNKQLGVAAVGSTPDPYDDQIAAIRSELVKARTDNDQAAAKLMATTGGGPSSASMDAEADEIVAADPGLVSLKTALNKRRSDLISQMANLTPSNPVYKQDAEELAKINSSLDSMTKDLRAKAAAQIEQKLKNDLERTSSVEARLNAQLAQMTTAAGGATSRLQRASDLSTDIARLQNRFTAVDEQFRNLTMENAAPGAVYLSAPAVAPVHADRVKVYRNALVILLIGIVLALGAALIAHNLDPRIYIAADVERVLGFAPMALLPDLYEVGTGVAEEYMLRLAAAVEHAHQDGNLHSCIFTGVAPGAGATTVSTRVSSMLQAMGRETVLVDAAGARAPREPVNPGTELVHAPRGTRSTALLQQMTDEAGEETIVVTDTAPLLVSGETEYLARFVDSAIVIIESGVTTKTQLREAAETLERLDVAAVGFVLNRISLEKANPAFRASVQGVEKHLKAQARIFDRICPHPLRSEAPAEHAELAGLRSASDHLLDVTPEPAETSSGKEPRTHADAAPPEETHGNAEARKQEEGWLAEAEPAVTQARETAPLAAEVQEMPAHTTTGREHATAPQSEAEARFYEPAPVPTPASDRELLSYFNKLEQTAGKPGPRMDETVITASAQQPAAPSKFVALRWTEEDGSPAVNSSSRSVSGANGNGASAATVPARPTRGREGPHIVLGDRAQAPMTGEEVPDQWRAVLRTEARTSIQPQPSSEHEPVPAQAATSGNGHVPPRRWDPFAEMRRAQAQKDPLLAWWENLAASDPQEVLVTDAEIVPEPETAPQFAAAGPHPSAEAKSASKSPAAGAVPSNATTAKESIPAARIQVPAQDEVMNRAASRLGGLRNLLVSLGIQNLHQGAEQRKAEARNESHIDPPTVRPVLASPVMPTSPVTPNGNGEASVVPSEEPIELIARPEIMPPKFNPDAAERKKEPKTPAKSPRITRWDNLDDVETLPARRGQYRQRS